MTQESYERLQIFLKIFKEEVDGLDLDRNIESFLDNSFFLKKREVEGHAFAIMRVLVKEFYKE